MQFGARSRRVIRGALLPLAAGLAAAAAPPAAAQEPDAHVLIYSGTVAHRHADTIAQGIGPIQAGLDDAGITHDWEDCDGAGTGAGQCQNPDENPRVFTPENLAQYDAIFLFNAGGNTPGPLWTEPQRDAIQGFVNDGGGIAANHLATDMGAGQPSWGWWDGLGNSALGTTMPAHPAAPQEATVHVSDRNHPSTAGLAGEFQHSDEHYSFHRSVRGTHHVLATLDETSYDPLAEPHGGGAPPALAMGSDHPISWCRHYDGGRIWATAMGHFPNLYTQNGGDNYLIDHLVGGVQWVAGVAGDEGDCGGTVWSNFRRTILTSDVQGPIGLDIAEDGTVYWTEIGEQGMESEGRLEMWDPDTGESSVVHVIPTRADALSTSEDGVLAMALDPDFGTNRHLYIYYSPRGEDEGWPVEGTGFALGYNRLSRFTLNEAGTAVVEEQPILDVPKVKVAEDGDGIGNPGSPNWPAHTGGAGLDFDSEGNLYLGVGDDVNPFGTGQNGYAPMDQQYEHRYDARNTSANTNDLRGKVLRIDPLEVIEPGAEPGVGETYAIPEGNMFEPGTPDTRPEIYAMGFRQPFTVQADPAEPGTIVVGEYGPDSATNNANRGPAGIVEWNHITEPGFFGWPFCTGDNSNANSYNRYTYPSGPSGERYDCSAATVPNESEFNTGLDDAADPGARRRLAQADRRAPAGVRPADPGLAPGGDHRPDLPLRPRQPVGDEVARVLRRLLADPRPRAELVARGADDRRRAAAAEGEQLLPAEPVRDPGPHLGDPCEVRSRRLALPGPVHGPGQLRTADADRLRHRTGRRGRAHDRSNRRRARRRQRQVRRPRPRALRGERRPRRGRAHRVLARRRGVEPDRERRVRGAVRRHADVRRAGRLRGRLPGDRPQRQRLSRGRDLVRGRRRRELRVPAL